MINGRTEDRYLVASLEFEGVLRACLHRYARNAADVDELLQETYAHLLAAGAAKGREEVRSIRAFALTVARNVALSWLRHRQVVPIELTEFAIQSPIQVFRVGTSYRFVISNPGAINHEFVLMPEGQEHHMQDPAHAEHHAEDGGHTQDTDHMMMDGSMLHISQSDLAPGATVTVEFAFSQPGEYQFGCYLPGHYEAGMFTTVTVIN